MGIGGDIIAPNHDTTRHEPWRVPQGILPRGLTITSAGAMSIAAAIVANADPTHIVGFGLLGALLAVILARGIRPSGLRRVSATWLVIALTVEACLAVFGMASMVGIAIVLLFLAAPPAGRRFNGWRTTAAPAPPHHRPSTWSDQGLTRPCLTD